MNLAPAERQALAEIETALRRTDPLLAARLAGLTLSPVPGTTGRPELYRRAAPRIIMRWALTILGGVLAALAVAHSPAGRATGQPGTCIASPRQVAGCPRAGGLTAGAAGPLWVRPAWPGRAAEAPVKAAVKRPVPAPGLAQPSRPAHPHRAGSH